MRLLVMMPHLAQEGETNAWLYLAFTLLLCTMTGIGYLFHRLSVKRHTQAAPRLDSFNEAQSIARLGTFVWKVGTEEMVCSDQVYRIFGYEPRHTPMPIEHIRACLHDETARTFDEALQAIQKGEENPFTWGIYRPDGAVRVIELCGRLAGEAAGPNQRVIGTITDVTDRAELTQLLEETQSIARVGGWAITLPDYHLSWTAEVYRIHEVPLDATVSVEEAINFYHPDSRPLIQQAVKDGIEHGKPWDMELQLITAKDRLVWVRAMGKAYKHGDKVYRVAGTCQDITERKKIEQRQKRMLAELDHRVKNNVATIMAMARQTMESVDSLEAFRDSFLGRLNALAGAHDALAQTRWEGASLSGILQRTFAPYSLRDTAPVTLVGPNVVLPTHVALPLGLTLHELATNAAKYGALCAAGGHIHIHWQQNHSHMSIYWKESGGPPPSPKPKPGTGTRLIDGFISYELRGKIEMEFSNDGLQCSIQIPL